MINGVVCVDENWAIGKDNHLLFNIPEDMKFFKEKTTGHTVVMGYNTLLSLPRSNPLKNRRNIVLCADNIDITGCEVVHSLDELLQLLTTIDDDIYIMGGASVYKLMLPYYDRVFVTKVNADGEGTVFFPNLDENNSFTIVNESGTIHSNGYEIKFLTYERK